MEEDKTLQPFKIGDTRKPTVHAPQKSESADEPPNEAPTLGFRRIEGMLEREDPTAVRANLTTLKDSLLAFGETASTHRDKAAAKKAIGAIDRSLELVNFLYETKESLLRAAEKKAP